MDNTSSPNFNLPDDLSAIDSMHEMQPVRQQQQLVAVQGEFEPREAELSQISEETKFTPIISTGDNMNVKTAGQTEDTLLRNWI